MEVICIIGMIAFIRLVIAQVEKLQAASENRAIEQTQALCTTCAYAHIALGFNERQKLMACTFGGTVRQFKFAVSDCTLYCIRGATEQTVQVVGFGGFAQETQDALIAAKAKR